MDVTITADELVAAFLRDWPMQYEISTLRLALAAHAARVAELEPPPTADQGTVEGGGRRE